MSLLHSIKKISINVLVVKSETKSDLSPVRGYWRAVPRVSARWQPVAERQL